MIDKLENDKQRAYNVNNIVNNPEYLSAFVKIQADYINRLTKTGFGDEKEREYLHKMLLLVSELENHFNKVIVDGKMAEKTILQRIKQTTMRKGL
jgi:hypothetical protein